MKAFVTGSTGFAGCFLMQHLRALQQDVVGTSHPPTSEPQTIQVNLLNYDEVKAVISSQRPDTIYHLAAYSSPAQSFREPVKALNETAAMQINLYEACLEVKASPKFVIVSSGQIYDANHLPITEDAPLSFSSPYAVAKAGQEHIADFYAKRGFNSIIARPFNHIGPKQQLGFLVSDLAKQVAEIEKTGRESTLKAGNLSSKRDFTDVRDIVRAYALLAEKGEPGEIYNICSGRSVSGQEILNILLTISHKDIKTEEDPERMRPSDIPDLYGDPAKLHKATGWEPEIPLEQTLGETLEYWRKRV